MWYNYSNNPYGKGFFMKSYFEMTESPSTARALMNSGTRALTQRILKHDIRQVLEKEPSLPPSALDDLTQKFCELVMNYESRVFQLAYQGDYDPDLRTHNAVIMNMLVTGICDRISLYEPVWITFGERKLSVSTGTYKALFHIVHTALLDRMSFVQRIEYATKCFPLFSALKRLLLKKRSGGETYYEYICRNSHSEVDPVIWNAARNAARYGYYHFGNDEAVNRLSDLLVLENGEQPVKATNLLREWRNGKAPHCETDTIFKFAYAFALPLYPQADGEYSAEYLFENALESVWDVFDAEHNLMRFGLAAGMKYQDAMQLMKQYTAYCTAHGTAHACPEPWERETIQAEITGYLKQASPEPEPFFALLASLGIEPERDKSVLKEKQNMQRKAAARDYLFEIFKMLEEGWNCAAGLRELYNDLCIQAQDTLIKLKNYGELDAAAAVVAQYFGDETGCRYMSGDELFAYYSEIYNPENALSVFKQKEKDVGYTEENADADLEPCIAALLDRLCDNATDNGKSRLSEKKFCDTKFNITNIKKILDGEEIADKSGKRALNRNIILRIAYLHTYFSGLCTDEPDFNMFESFRRTADSMLKECLFLPYQPSFMPDAIFTQAMQQSKDYFCPLIYQIFLPKMRKYAE